MSLQERYATEAEAIARARELRAADLEEHGPRKARGPAYHYAVTESARPGSEPGSVADVMRWFVERELGAPMIRTWERRVFSTSDPE